MSSGGINRRRSPGREGLGTIADDWAVQSASHVNRPLLNSAISRPAPIYPTWAGYTSESTVVIKVVIGEEGKVISARLLSADRLLGWLAIEALRQWRWQPAILHGSPVKVLGCLSFTLTPDCSLLDGSTETAVADDTGGSTDADLLSPSAIAQFEQDRHPAIIPHMLVPGDPTGFEVEVVSARFEFGEIWRSSRPAPDDHLYADSPQSEVNVTSVDSRPIALNSLRPNYTEGARRNKVNGTCRLRLLVGADGSVKRVNIVTPLPDHLTEEAIKASFQIKFSPAMKSGQPVAFWTTLEVDFSLR
jgi:TonB family protein